MFRELCRKTRRGLSTLRSPPLFRQSLSRSPSNLDSAFSPTAPLNRNRYPILFLPIALSKTSLRPRSLVCVRGKRTGVSKASEPTNSLIRIHIPRRSPNVLFSLRGTNPGAAGGRFSLARHRECNSSRKLSVNPQARALDPSIKGRTLCLSTPLSSRFPAPRIICLVDERAPLGRFFRRGNNADRVGNEFLTYYRR